MDYLRSCYSTNIWAIDPATGGYVNVPIRWYWAPPGAQHFPARHQYGSTNWTRPTNYQERVGEVIGAGRTYDRGTVAPTKGVNICGSPDQYIGPMVLRKTPIPLWPYGQPTCCAEVPYWQADGALDLAGSAEAVYALPYHPDGALDLAGSAEAAYATSWDPDGPIRLRVDAMWSQGYGPTPDGHLTLSGSATYSHPPPPYGGCSVYPSGCGPEFSIIAAGFSGSCSSFNGTWVLPTPSSGCNWTITVSGVTVSLNVTAVGSASLQFSGGGGGAQYSISSGFAPLGTSTLNRVFTSCGAGTGPATLTVTATS